MERSSSHVIVFLRYENTPGLQTDDLVLFYTVPVGTQSFGECIGFLLVLNLLVSALFVHSGALLVSYLLSFSSKMSRDFVQDDITFNPPADDPLLIANMDPDLTLEDFQARFLHASVLDEVKVHVWSSSAHGRVEDARECSNGVVEMFTDYMEVLAKETLKLPQGAIMKARVNQTFHKQLLSAVIKEGYHGWLQIKPFSCDAAHSGRICGKAAQGFFSSNTWRVRTGQSMNQIIYYLSFDPLAVAQSSVS